MGGFNSGRRATTPDTDDCLRLSLTELGRSGVFQRGQRTRLDLRWTRYGGRQETGPNAPCTSTSTASSPRRNTPARRPGSTCCSD